MIRWFAIAALAVSLPDLAHAAKRRPPPDVVEDALAYAASDRTKAIALLEGALDEGVDALDLDIVELHAAEQHRLAGALDAAHDRFRAIVARTEKGFEHEAARLGLALVGAAAGVDAKTLAILNDISEKDALDSQNADRYRALAIADAKTGNIPKMQAWAKKALDAASDDPSQRARIDARLAELAAAPSAAVGLGGALFFKNIF